MFSRSIKSLLLATAISMPAAAVFVAPTVTLAQADNYSVPSQDLATALRVLADSAGVQVHFTAADVAGKTSTAVVNAPTLDEAIKTLLTGTGLTAKVAKDGTVTISGAGKGDELVVTGRRFNLSSSQAELRSTNQVSVITAKELESHPDSNVAEALSRITGISVLNGGYGNTNGVQVDEAGRGEGNFISLRGMDAEYIVDLVNGVPAAEGMPYSREVQLNLLPPTGLQQIVVNKTLTADMEGDAVGGTIDFRTPTAFDFSGTTHASITAGGSDNDRANAYGLDGTGANVNADFARKFGSNNQIGVYVAGYYDEHNFANSIIDGIYPAQTNGQWTYALQTASGASAAPNPANNLTLEGINAGLTQGSEDRYGGALSIDWRPNDTTSLYLRSTYGRDIVQQNTYYSQLYAQNFGTAPIGNGLFVPSITTIQPRFYYETNPEDAILENLEAGGEKQFGHLHLSLVAFTSYAANNEPNHIETSARLPEFGNGFPFSGSSMFTNQNGAPVAILSTSELAQIGNVANYGARRPAEETDEYAHQKKYGVKFDASYDVDNGWLDSVKAGVSYTESTRQHMEQDYTENKYSQSDDPTFGGQGYLNGSVSAIVPGVYNFPIPLINQTALRALFNSSLASNGGIQAISDQCNDNYAINNDNCNTQRGTEALTAVYAMAKIKVGDLEVLPGVRYEHTGITNTYWETPEAPSEQIGYFTSDNSTFDKVLPSIQANYRPSESVVYRASIYQSYVEPSMFQLGGGEQYSKDDAGDVTITMGNPHLKAMDATNYDLSGEWTNHAGGAASAGIFYKALDNFIYDTINGFTNQTATGSATTTIYTPENGGSGRVYGVELAASQKFQDMPAPFNGLGVAGNLTYEQSSVNTGDASLSSHERLLDQPNFAGNGQIFYEKGAYDANLAVRYTGDYVAQYGTLGGVSALDTWVRANVRVDMHLGYTTPWHVHLTFAIQNLLDANSYEATVGKSSWTIPDIVYSGRTYSLKAGYTF